MSVTQYPGYRGLRLEEDEALKRHLSGLSLPDAKGRLVEVPVRFWEPNREMAPANPPYILIHPMGTAKDAAREHRGWNIYFGTEPYTANEAPGGMLIGQYPIPLLLTYQVTAVTRVNQHDVILTDILCTNLLPFRWGQIECVSGTVRPLNVVEGPDDSSNLASDGRREFRKVWTIQVEAELAPGLRNVVPVEEVVLEVDGQVKE